MAKQSTIEGRITDLLDDLFAMTRTESVEVMAWWNDSHLLEHSLREVANYKRGHRLEYNSQPSESKYKWLMNRTGFSYDNNNC